MGSSVPVPAAVTDAWTRSRSTGYRYVMGMFEDADISGPHATPHGLRHAF